MYYGYGTYLHLYAYIALNNFLAILHLTFPRDAIVVTEDFQKKERPLQVQY